jgi:hypothetical protein
MSDISTEAFSSELKTGSRQENTSRQKWSFAPIRSERKRPQTSPQLPQAIGNDRMTAPDGIPSPSRALIARLPLRGFVEEALC